MALLLINNILVENDTNGSRLEQPEFQQPAPESILVDIGIIYTNEQR